MLALTQWGGTFSQYSGYYTDKIKYEKTKDREASTEIPESVSSAGTRRNFHTVKASSLTRSTTSALILPVRELLAVSLNPMASLLA